MGIRIFEIREERCSGDAGCDKGEEIKMGSVAAQWLNVQTELQTTLPWSRFKSQEGACLHARIVTVYSMLLVGALGHEGTASKLFMPNQPTHAAFCMEVPVQISAAYPCTTTQTSWSDESVDTIACVRPVKQ